MENQRYIHLCYIPLIFHTITILSVGGFIEKKINFIVTKYRFYLLMLY